MSAVSACPTCRSPAKPRSENPAFPFCSARCRAVDLGRWFLGAYCVPSEPAQEQPKERKDGEPEPQ